MSNPEVYGPIGEFSNYPKPCPECPTEQQMVFWRVFTPPAYKAFLDNDGVGTRPVDWEKIGENQILNTAVLDTPGVLWASQNMVLSFSVGMARAVTEGHPSMTMLGFTHCQHRINQGEILFDTLGCTRNQSRITPVQTLPPPYELSSGVIFPRISPVAVDEGVVLHYSDDQIEIFREYFLYEPEITTIGLSQRIGEVLLGSEPSEIINYSKLWNYEELESIVHQMRKNQRNRKSEEAKEIMYERLGSIEYVAHIHAQMLIIEKELYSIGYDSHRAIGLIRKYNQLSDELSIWKHQIGNNYMDMVDRSHAIKSDMRSGDKKRVLSI